MKARRPVVFVSGASSGIGAACVAFFAARGWDAVAAARRKEKLEALAASVSEAHPGASVLPVACDVNSDESVGGAFEALRTRFGRLDALVNNAGFAVYGTLAETPLERFRENMETNYFGVLRCTRAALPLLRAAAGEAGGRRSAAIVMVSSIVGRRAFPGTGAYCASKFALEGLSEALRLELEVERISVSVVNPGVTRTAFFDVAAGRRPDQYLKPKSGMAPEAVARAVWSAVRRPRRNVYLTAMGKAGVALQWLSPRLFDLLIRRTWKGG